MKSTEPLKILNDGRGVWVMPLLYGTARLAIGPRNSMVFDDVY